MFKKKCACCISSRGVLGDLNREYAWDRWGNTASLKNVLRFLRFQVYSWLPKKTCQFSLWGNCGKWSYKPYVDLETVTSKLFFRRFSWEGMVHLKILQEWTRDFFFPFPLFLLLHPWASLSSKNILWHNWHIAWHLFTFLLIWNCLFSINRGIIYVTF